MKSDKLDTGFLPSDSLCCCETEPLMLQHVQYTLSDQTKRTDNGVNFDLRTQGGGVQGQIFTLYVDIGQKGAAKYRREAGCHHMLVDTFVVQQALAITL